MDMEKAMNEYIKGVLRKNPYLANVLDDLKLAYLEGSKQGMETARRIYA